MSHIYAMRDIVDHIDHAAVVFENNMVAVNFDLTAFRTVHRDPKAGTFDDSAKHHGMIEQNHSFSKGHCIINYVMPAATYCIATYPEEFLSVTGRVEGIECTAMVELREGKLMGHIVSESIGRTVQFNIYSTQRRHFYPYGKGEEFEVDPQFLLKQERKYDQATREGDSGREGYAFLRRAKLAVPGLIEASIDMNQRELANV